MAKVVMGVKIGERIEDSVRVQKILSESGCIIRTRLGLHEAGAKGQLCSIGGIVVLEFVEGVEAEITKLENELKSVDSVVVKKMEF